MSKSIYAQPIDGILIGGKHICGETRVCRLRISGFQLLPTERKERSELRVILAEPLQPQLQDGGEEEEVAKQLQANKVS